MRIQQRTLAQRGDQRAPVVAAAELRLAEARAVYAETHPDVILAKQALAEAKRLAKDTSEKLPIQSLDEQIAFNNSQIAALRNAKARSEEHTSEIQSLMRISYAVFCLKKKNKKQQ